MKAILLVLGLLLIGAAQAHKPSDAYLRLTLQGQVLEQRFDIALRDLDRDLQLDADDDGELRWGEVRQRAAEIAALAEQGLGLQLLDAQGAACPAGPLQPLQLDSHSDGRYLLLRRQLVCAAAPQELTLRYRLFAASDPTHRGVAHLALDAPAARTLVLAPDGQARRFPLGQAAATPAPSLASFFVEGIHHIWIGVDHLLFLLSLLLPAVLVRPAGRWQPAPRLRPVLAEVLGVVTAFTVAHSITLALAAFDLVDPPSRWVESLIAFSVLLAALNNLYPLLDSGRWRLTLVFGLVHGFGFAGALKDLGLAQGGLAGPLVMFNLGVEAGQLAIVAVFVPLAWVLRKQGGYRRGLLGGGSALIALLATVWLAERALDLKLP
ncbi:HupE/UreJ family protein [Roseateles violae]|uniref:HupE/UreJ family protein n=1 Tax=Roseateles violae TaxID=3058042 RepID=A0ABT8DY63_9BURK|nr:HupE/UreJ family protein [Pelomonas sp. PFR6]MDN3922139.1 HupE/UreJ family protein [Pelomonas sp. PFR6]